MFEFFSVFFDNPIIRGVFSWIIRLWFLWAPALLAVLFWNSWLSQKRLQFLRTFSWILLEVRVPRDISKSPKAMEAVLSSFFSASAGSWWKRVWGGFLPGWYSLEIASINGRVHFYIRVQKSLRNFVESQIYAQYSDAEIMEVDDYSYASDFDNLGDWNIWAGELGLNKADAYPIKTYVDFGLHETSVKEEQKVNPLVSFLELLGSLEDGEQIWFQIMIKGAGKKWSEEGKKLVDELMGRNKPAEEGKSGRGLSKGEQEVVSAIEKNISKLGFDTGIRTVYVARKDIFNPVNIASIVGLMNQYNTQNLNGFKIANSTSAGLLFKTKREMANKISMIDAYRRRSYFHIPHKRKPFVFNTEELATIYHFPGRVAETPTFGRVESKKSEPPTTLPV